MAMVKTGNSFWIVLFWIILFGIAVEKIEGSIENILKTRRRPLVYEDGNGDGFVWNYNDEDQGQLADADTYGSTTNSAAGFVDQGIFTDADIYNYILQLQGDQGTMIMTGDEYGNQDQNNSMNSQGEQGIIIDDGGNGYQASHDNSMSSAADINNYYQQLQAGQGTMTTDGGESSYRYDQGEDNSLNSASATTNDNVREYKWVNQSFPNRQKPKKKKSASKTVNKDNDSPKKEYTVVGIDDKWFQEFPGGVNAEFTEAPKQANRVFEIIPETMEVKQENITNTSDKDEEMKNTVQGSLSNEWVQVYPGGMNAQFKDPGDKVNTFTRWAPNMTP